MALLPTLSGREVVKAFGRDGWQLTRQRGSHMILVKAGHIQLLMGAPLSLKQFRKQKPPAETILSGQTPDNFR